MNNKNIAQEIQVLINQFNVKNFDLVISKGNILLKKNPEYVILYNLIGSAHQNNNNYSEAKKFFKSGLQLDPKNIALMNNLAMSYKNLLEYSLAAELYDKILKLNNKYLNAYINYGNLKRDLNQFKEAINLYEEALNLTNKNPVVLYSLALAYQGIGDFDKSISFAKKTLDLDPKFTRADHLISQSKKYERKDEHYISLKNKIENTNLNDFEKVDLYFALAKAEEDFGNIAEASDYIIKGNKLKKKIINYKLSTELNLCKNIIEKFKDNNFEELSSNYDDNIIFILGMPRSGTSLVEQIISSHKDVFGAGELPILSNIIKDHFINDQQLIIEDLKDEIEKPTKIDICRSRYFDFIKNFNYSEKYITDKAPLNFRWIGFIKVLFPNAKIVHCIREPKNNCLSMFKNVFEGGLNFTYDQEDLVKYYNQYQELMNFWKSKYANSIYSIKYEELIENNEEEIKKIIKFCNLSWDEKCLSFHKNKTPIKTMSTAQARKPIYKSSLNSFEKYKNYFKEINKL